MRAILDALRVRARSDDGAALQGDLEGDLPGLARKDFERLVAALAREKLVELREDSFEKEGRTIRFRRVTLRPEGYRAATGRERRAGGDPAGQADREEGKTKKDASGVPEGEPGGERRRTCRRSMRSWRSGCASGGWRRRGGARCRRS